MDRKTIFADVIVPLALPQLFTYRVPQFLNAEIRELQRVVVPFGKKKKYTAIIHHLHETPPANYEARYIESVLDAEQVLNTFQLRFWTWISDYYMCSLGEVMQAALPAGLKLSSETIVKPYGVRDREHAGELTDREFLILDALEKTGQLSISDVEQIAGIKTVYPIIRGLIDKRMIIAEEEMNETFKQKTEIYIGLNPEFEGEDGLNALLNQLNKAPKQQEVLLGFLSMNQAVTLNLKPVKRKELLAKVPGGLAPLNQLIKKGIFVSESRVVSRLSGDEQSIETVELSAAQEIALEQLHEGFAEKQTILLHGLTGSGKTELYIRLISEQLAQGNQVLYLLPEIALTAQIINRLRKHFGRTVQVYHSRFSENERVEVWNAVSASHPEGSVILGARSSVFLPFTKLGLIIVDEEHEPSFKQHEPAPRYHARDAAIVLGSLYKARVLLGSGTPSIETYYNAVTGKYGLVKLEERFGGAKLPEIEINDLQEDTKRRRMQGIFSPALIKQIDSTLKAGNQVILFQNRRGFAPLLDCQNCHWVPQCVQCDISLTYHKAIHQLRCHYCGYAINVPAKCNECGSPDIRMKGFGTEKIEEELTALFPDVSSSRMDLDTTRSKFSYHKLIDDFEQRRVDVLIGTQMVTKGLDFGNVTLVGVLSADSMLNYPDFRSFERCFQLLSQVAGRSGRRQLPGKVLIQTWKPDHPVLKYVQEHNFLGFYEAEIIERRQYNYPPFSKLIHVTLKHEQQAPLDSAAESLANFLRQTFGSRILGPEYPSIARIRNYFQKRILIKVETTASLKKVKAELANQIAAFFKEHPLKQFRLVVDVDPS
jgi:primosomal protein N' (replication factor Y)